MLTRGPVFFMLVWETKTIIKFFQRSRKIQYKLALIPPSMHTKTLIYKDLWYSDDTVAVSEVFAASKIKT